MSMDQRIDTKHPPMYGCHSDLDKYRPLPAPECDYHDPYAEKGCEGCKRRLQVEDVPG